MDQIGQQRPTMGKAQTMANDRYKEMCARLGDLNFRKYQVEREMGEVLEQIRALNAEVPFALQVEAEAVQALIEQQRKDELMQKELTTKVAEKMKHGKAETAPSGS